MSDDNVSVVARATLKRLRGSGITIDKDALIDNYVEVEFKDTLDAATNEDDRKRLKERFKKWYTEGDGKDFMDEQIEKLQDIAKKVQNDISNLTTSANNVVASNAVPSVLTTGSATSAPNPAWFAIENRQKKMSLLVICNSINKSLQELMTIAILIHWQIPDSILNSVQLYSSLYSIITAI